MPLTTAGTKELDRPRLPLPWKRREDHPELFTDTDQYLVAVQVRYNDGPCYWEYSVIRFRCDEEFLAIDCNDEPWGWSWEDVDFYLPLSEFRIYDHDSLAADVLAMCKQRDWSLHWTARGAYLHLESSELIESLRGKRGEPLSEAADVLLVLMSITENAGLKWSDVVAKARETCNRLKEKPRYKGEEFATPTVKGE
jgi:hypothetical protein